MKTEKTAYVTREAILELLSDNEVAAVSTAETALHLNRGDEYIDLDHIEHGIQHGPERTTPMGHVLPRKVVSKASWLKIVALLSKSEKSSV